MKIHTFAVGLLTAATAGQVVPARVWAVDVPTTAVTTAAEQTTAERAPAAPAEDRPPATDPSFPSRSS